MKTDTHPTYYSDCLVTCACGNRFKTGSTKKEIRVEVCAACHPFFTGEQKFVDTEGRVDKFLRKQKEAQSKGEIIKARKEAKKKRTSPQNQPKSLKELLETEKTALQQDKKTETPAVKEAKSEKK